MALVIAFIATNFQNIEFPLIVKSIKLFTCAFVLLVNGLALLAFVGAMQGNQFKEIVIVSSVCLGGHLIYYFMAYHKRFKLKLNIVQGYRN